MRRKEDVFRERKGEWPAPIHSYVVCKALVLWFREVIFFYKNKIQCWKIVTEKANNNWKSLCRGHSTVDIF